MRFRKAPKRYGHHYLPVSFFIFIIILHFFGAVFSRAEENSDYASSLIRRADELALYNHEAWRALVHYKETLFGTKSLIDDPKFFLSPEGKRNPKAELHATIRAILSSPHPGEKHPVCRFSARFQWLKEMLAFDESKLPVKGCTEIELLINRIAPKSATLVFPASHINSPASMFGHTLLSIETANRSKLLAHAIDYAANTNDTFGPAYAFKGIFGFYHGYFNNQPYYAKIQQYNDFDQRDLWEYRLNFTEGEVRKMMYHIFELDFIYSDYYFFDENCSYNILFLLDVARPSLKLTDTFYTKIPTWVIPVDTIRAIDRKGLVESVECRPSRVSTIRHLGGLLSAEAKKLARDITHGKKGPEALLESTLTPEEKSRVGDLITEHIRYRYSREDISKEEYSALLIRALATRSKIESAVGSPKVPLPERPDFGHYSARAFLGFGILDTSPFQEVRLRPSYHTLLDADEGYIEGGQIVFTDFVFRFYDIEKRVELERWHFIDIVSLTPNDPFIHSISWKITTGLRRMWTLCDERPLTAFLNPGGGYAWKTPFGIMYGMIETELLAGKALEHGLNWGAGISLGILSPSMRACKIHINARDIYFAFDQRQHETSAGAGFRISITRNFNFMIEGKYISAQTSDFAHHTGMFDGTAGFNVYF